MRRFVLLALLLLLPFAASGAEWWLKTGGTGPRQDLDGDGLYEDAYLWDADGDGSPGFLTCVGQDNPLPQCKVAGERVYADGADDINCAIHDCGFGQMELNGVLRLSDGVTAIFPCWDVGAWRADASIQADPAANCPAAGINDPRGLCQPGGETGTTTRYDDLAGDAAVHADCPLDAGGSPLYSVAFQDWQGTLQGTGIDLRENDRDLLIARGEGRVVGTTLAYDHGNNDLEWFDKPGFIRIINFGRDIFFSGQTYRHQGGFAATEGDAKGWGAIRGFSTTGQHSFNTATGGSVCVCNDSLDCDNVAGLASSDNWIASLADDDPVLLYLFNNRETSAGSAWVVMLYRDNFGEAGCGSDGYVQFRLGTKGPTASDKIQTFPWGSLLTGTAAQQLVAPVSSYFNNRTKVRDLTIEAQDSYSEGSGQCACEDFYSDSLEAAGNCPGAATRDLDCDTHPQTAMQGGGETLIEDVAFKEWHHFSVDGGPHPGISRFESTYHGYGHGYAFADDSAGWRWNKTRVYNTSFSGQMFGGFFSYSKYRDLELVNVNAGRLIEFNEGVQELDIDGLYVFNSSWDRFLSLQCGARGNSVRNVSIKGSNQRHAAGLVDGMIHLECDAHRQNSGFCAAEGELRDLGGSATTDNWCDSSIRDNLFENWTFYGNIGTPLYRYRFQSIDAGTDTVTVETGSDLQNMGECSGPYFVFDAALSCNGAAGCSNANGVGYYAKSVNYAAGTFQLSRDSTDCTDTEDLTGSATPAGSQMNLQGEGQYASIGIKFDTTAGQERAFQRNIFENIRIFSPLNAPCFGTSSSCPEGTYTNNLVVLDQGGTGDANVNEILWWNTFSNSYVEDGVPVGQCSDANCFRVDRLASAATPRGNNLTGGRAATMYSTPTYDGPYRQILFGGDLPAAADTTWWLPPMVTANATTAAADDRPSRQFSGQVISSAFGIGSVPEDAAAVGTVDEPVSPHMPLVIEGMSCALTGDAVSTISFTLYVAGSATAATCTITAGANFEDGCSIAPAVTTGAAPITAAAGAAMAVQANNTGAGDQTDLDAICAVYTHPQ